MGIGLDRTSQAFDLFKYSDVSEISSEVGPVLGGEVGPSSACIADELDGFPNIPELEAESFEVAESCFHSCVLDHEIRFEPNLTQRFKGLRIE